MQRGAALKRVHSEQTASSSLSPIDDSTTHSTPPDGSLIAIIENRAKEIGVAVFDRDRHILLLGQFIETSLTYTVTLTLLHRHTPRCLLLVDERTKSRAGGLNRAVRDYFDDYPLPRSAFDDSEGAFLVERLAIKGHDSLKRPKEGSHYLAVGAAGALLRYLRDVEHHVMSDGSLDVEWIGTDKHVQLDLGSMTCLGIVHPTRPKDKTCPPSLFAVMHRTKTQCGTRLLKANLLQPLTHGPTLMCRYDAVQELVENDALRHDCESALKTIPQDLDRICSIFTLYLPDPNEDLRPGKDVATSRRISYLVDGVMLMKDVLESLQGLSDAIQSTKSLLLRGIYETLSCKVFNELLQSVRSVLDDHVHRQRSAALKRIEQCYAIKSGYDGFLDVARTNFCKITEQIHELANRLQGEHHLQNIKVSFHSKRGFSFLITTGEQSTSSQSSLPDGWMVIDKRGHHVHCVTHELIALNARLKDATHDCMLLTQQALENVVEAIVHHMSPIRKMVDSVATLDLLWSFADLAVSSSGCYCQPVITKDGSLVISAGRHPCYEVMDDIDFCPNDTFLSPFSSCHIITGSNMSGKTTYLKQVALLVIMAQVGSFVPAEAFLYSPLEAVFCRMGFSDSIETNASSFMVEMQEMAYILSNATSRSLIVVDELGRATGTADGESIAWAVGEKLIEIGSYTLIATHFKDLPHLTRLYPNAKLQNFETVLEGDALRFTWKLRSVPTQELTGHLPGHYGIRLARILDFPKELLQRAEVIADAVHVKTLPRLSPIMARIDGVGSMHRHVVYGLSQKLLCLTASRQDLEHERLREELKELKRSLQQALM